MNIAVTRFKVGQLLDEIPSKRLLVKYLGAHSDEELVQDLTRHFKVCVYVCMCVCVYMCVYVCICVCMCVYVCV
jgi:hypothetical protein